MNSSAISVINLDNATFIRSCRATINPWQSEELCLHGL